MSVPPAAGQARREAAVQPVAEVRSGDLSLGWGVVYALDGRYPLGGLRGDLFVPARLHVAYGLGPRALFEVRGSAWQILSIDERTDGPVELEPGADDGTTSDAGDFELSAAFLPIGRTAGWSAGGAVSVKLPNTDERKGIGPNTTDVTISALLSWGGERLRLTGRVGVGILEAPLETFEQNDVVAYAVEALLRPRDDLRLALGVDGRASTRSRIAVGTEDLGRLRAGAEWRLGAIALDVAVGRGFAGDSRGWSVEAGIVRLARRPPRRPS